MKGPRLLDGWDDWLNPIVVKELRQAVQSRLVVTALLLFLGLQLFSVGLFLMYREAKSGADGIDWRAGADVFPWLQAFLLGTCMLLIPAYTAVRLASERSDTNVDLLFISTLRPRSIIAGKFLAALVLAMLAFSACAPFMTFSYLMRGLDLPTILVMLGIDVLSVVFGTQVALLLGAVPANRGLKFLLTLSGLIGLGILFVSVLGLTLGPLGLMAGSFDFSSAPREAWAWVGTMVLLVAGSVSLLFCWTVAVVSPPSSNRAPPARLVLVVGWLVTGGLAAAWSTNYRGGGLHHPMFLWCLLSVALLCLQLVISINERTVWGPRVARSIPRNLWLRLPAFLFTSGAGGGILLALGLIGLTLLANEFWRERYPAMPGAEGSALASRFAALLALYVYCYAMSGVLLRAYVIKGRVPRQFTWVVMVVLIGAGSSIPYLLAYLYLGDALRTYTGHEWWLVANLFMMLYEVRDPRGQTQLVEWAFDFTIVWSVLITLLSGPWLFRQVVRFQPLVPRGANQPVPAPEPASAAPISATGATSMQTG